MSSDTTDGDMAVTSSYNNFGTGMYNNSGTGMQNNHTVEGGGDTTFVQNLATDTIIISNNTTQNIVIQNVVAQNIIVQNNNIQNFTLNTGASPFSPRIRIQIFDNIFKHVTYADRNRPHFHTRIQVYKLLFDFEALSKLSADQFNSIYKAADHGLGRVRSRPSDIDLFTTFYDLVVTHLKPHDPNRCERFQKQWAEAKEKDFCKRLRFANEIRILVPRAKKLSSKTSNNAETKNVQAPQ
ncbi:hypothetical protein V5O48_014049 [Marasmius crinis-equi]|uniref:Uncharacterized protein n=1 Tax=Marasmius crinis-equi TaxID=585013 RepID=A0ABR3EYH6_9AGAR